MTSFEDSLRQQEDLTLRRTKAYETYVAYVEQAARDIAKLIAEFIAHLQQANVRPQAAHTTSEKRRSNERFEEPHTKVTTVHVPAGWRLSNVVVIDPDGAVMQMAPGTESRGNFFWRPTQRTTTYQFAPVRIAPLPISQFHWLHETERVVQVADHLGVAGPQCVPDLFFGITGDIEVQTETSMRKLMLTFAQRP